jgi:hypothetical protein
VGSDGIGGRENVALDGPAVLAALDEAEKTPEKKVRSIT